VITSVPMKPEPPVMMILIVGFGGREEVSGEKVGSEQ